MALDTAPPQAFVWGANGAQLTPEQILAQQKVAQAMMERGMDYSPIRSPWQGMARVSQALLGAYDSTQLDKESRAQNKATADAYSNAPGLGGSAVAAGMPVAAANPDLSDAIAKVSAARSVDPQYLTRLAMVESGGKSDAASPLSSAKGPFQFINSTAQQYGLTDPTNPAASADAAARFTADNQKALAQSLGRQPTPGELYLAHQQGAGGASALLANPNAPVESVIGADAARNNGATPGMTAGQFAQKWTRKFQNNPQYGAKIAQIIGGDGSSPLDTANWPAGPVNSPGVIVQGDQPSPVDTAAYPAGPIGAPGSDTAALPPNARPTGPAVPASVQTVAQAMQPPQAQAVAQAPSAAPAGPMRSTVDIPPAMQSYIKQMLANPNTRDAGWKLYQQYAAPKDQWTASQNPDGSTTQRNALTGEMKEVVKPATSITEYNYYKQNLAPGEKPMDYATFSTAKARAGATNISNNVDMNSGMTYDKQLAEGLGKSHAALSNGVEEAQTRARDIAAMQGAVDTIQKNGGTLGGMGQAQILELKKTINSGSAALGISTPFSESDISDKEFLQKFNRQMAGAQAKGAVGSRVTNFELSNYLKANPGLDMSATGNQRLLGIQAQIEQRNIAVGNQIRNATAAAISKGQRIDPVTVQKIVQGYDEEHHIADPVNGQDLTQSYTLPEFQQPGQGTNASMAVGHEQNINGIKIKRLK